MKCINWFDYKNTAEFDQSVNSFDTLIVGNSISLDDRSRYSQELFTKEKKSICHFQVFYDEHTTQNLQITLDQEKISIKDTSIIKNKFLDQKILIDMTCFDVHDLTYLLYTLCKERINFSICYVEPKRYKKKEKSNSFTPSYSGEHSLSDEGNGINYLPPFLPSLVAKQSAYILSLGFESYRLAGFMQSDEIAIDSEKAFLLGVPAFDIGWEHKAINANYKHIKIENSNVHIVPADDPIQTFLKVDEIHRSLLSSNQQLNLLPLGTKPQSLGMIWFAIVKKLSFPNENIGLMYDFVKKIHNRTEEIRNIHLWNFDTAQSLETYSQ